MTCIRLKIILGARPVSEIRLLKAGEKGRSQVDHVRNRYMGRQKNRAKTKATSRICPH